MGGALAQESDGPVRLQVKIPGVTTAGAGALVVLAELGFEGVEVDDALAGCKRADLCGRVRGGLLRKQECGGKSEGKDCRKEWRILLHWRKVPFKRGAVQLSAVHPWRPSSHQPRGLMKRGFRAR
jgi:hypothetical protein